MYKLQVVDLITNLDQQKNFVLERKLVVVRILWNREVDNLWKTNSKFLGFLSIYWVNSSKVLTLWPYKGCAFWRLNRLGRGASIGPPSPFCILCSIVTRWRTKILQTVLHQMTTTFLDKYYNFCWVQHFSWTRVEKIWKFLTFRFLNKGSMNKMFLEPCIQNIA